MDEEYTLEESINEPLHDSPFYYRPFCLLTTVFALSNTAILLWGYPTIIVSSFLWIIYSAFHFIRRKTLALIVPWLLFITLISSYAVGLTYTEHRKPIKKLADENTALSQYVNTEPEYKISKIKAEVISEHYCESFGSSYRVKLLSVDGKKSYGHATLECPEPLNARPYDTLYCDGIFFNTGSDKTLKDKLYTMSNDIIALIETDSADVVYEGNSKIIRTAYEIREKISFNLHRICDDHSAASFAMAVVFGERDGMDQALERDCSALGIIHLLAVSGSHFSALIAALAFLFRYTYVPGQIRHLCFAVFAIAFAILCGGTSAILRASIMATFCMFVRFRGYEDDSLIALFFSLATLSIFRPYCVFDIGFLLSFFSTFGILLSLDRLIIPNKKDKISIRILNAVLGAFKLTLSATLFTFPIIALAYGNISFIGLLVNLIAGPVITFAMFVAIVLMITCNVPFVGQFAADFFELIYLLIQKLSNFIALNTDTALQLRAPYVPYLILLPLCLFILLRLLSINENLFTYLPLMLSLFCLIIANLVHIAMIKDTAEVALVSIENNECLVIRSETNGLICDFSDGTKSISEEAVDALLSDLYCIGIEGYMLTHYHVRHITTIGNSLRNHYIRTLLLPEPITDDEKSIAKAIEQLADRYGGSVTYYVIGEEFDFCGAKIIAEKYAHAYSTHPTVAMRFSYGGSGITYLGTGYTDSKSASALLTLALESDTVIMGGHGPKQHDTEYLINRHGGKIYVSPSCTYLPREGLDVRLTADKNGYCKAFWRLETQTQP